MLQPSTIKFLKSLARNNNKPWFDAHRSDYDPARADFTAFIQKVIDSFGKKETGIKHLLAKDCLYRINRDVRFSKDKTPYKKNFSASINREGKKSIHAGYYIHIQPGNSFVGGGIWHPMPEDLKKVRQEIDYNLADFKKVLSEKKFKSVYGDLDRSEEYLLTRVPRGYEPSNPAADYLRLKSFVAMFPIDDATVVSKDLVRKTVDGMEALKGLVDFLNRSME